MLRKLVLAAVTSLSLAAPLAVTPPARAHDRVEIVYPVPAHHHYHVYYRAHRHQPWIEYGRYRHFRHAQAAADYLAASGYHVVIH